MEGFVPYLGWMVLIVVVALVAVCLTKNGIFVRRSKQSIKEMLGGDEKDQIELLNMFRIFLGSPSGLKIFREAFYAEIDFFSKTHAERRGVIFSVKKWEDIPTKYGRPQSIINETLATCKGYVLLLHDRWGSPPGDSGGRSFSSGSEEEFRIAEEMYKRKQMHKIGVYFKNVDPERLQSPDEQLARVLKFKRWLEIEHILLYNELADADIDKFRQKVHIFMADWLDEIAPWRRPEEVKGVFDYESF